MRYYIDAAEYVDLYRNCRHWSGKTHITRKRRAIRKGLREIVQAGGQGKIHPCKYQSGQENLKL